MSGVSMVPLALAAIEVLTPIRGYVIRDANLTPVALYVEIEVRSDRALSSTADLYYRPRGGATFTVARLSRGQMGFGFAANLATTAAEIEYFASFRLERGEAVSVGSPENPRTLDVRLLAAPREGGEGGGGGKKKGKGLLLIIGGAVAAAASVAVVGGGSAGNGAGSPTTTTTTTTTTLPQAAALRGTWTGLLGARWSAVELLTNGTSLTGWYHDNRGLVGEVSGEVAMVPRCPCRAAFTVATPKGERLRFVGELNEVRNVLSGDIHQGGTSTPVVLRRQQP